jgi:hypothetical protein
MLSQMKIDLEDKQYPFPALESIIHLPIKVTNQIVMGQVNCLTSN